MFEKFVKYTDCVVEDVETIKDKRKNINLTAHVSLIYFFITYVTSFICYFLHYNVLGILLMVAGCILMVLIVGLIIKRELFGIVILLKEKGE